MSNSTASAHDGDRQARAQPSRDSHNATAADLGAQPACAPDAEIRELVDRFETAFADLGAGAEEAQQRAEVEADLFPDFSQDIFEEAAPARSVAAESARVFPMPRRDSEPAPKAAAKPAAASAAGRSDEVSLDEAFSILRASENRSAGAAPRPSAQPAAPAIAQPRPRPNAGERPRAPEPRARFEAEREPEPDSATAEWTTRSHKVRSIAIAATAAALVIGIAVGYLYGRTPAPQTPSAAIGTSQQGAPLLRLDPELHQR